MDCTSLQIYKLWASWCQRIRFFKVFSHLMYMGDICNHDIQSSCPISIKNNMQRFTLPDDSLIKIGQLNLDMNYFEHFDGQCRRTSDARPLPY